MTTTMTSNPICDVSASTMSSSSDGGSVSLSEACVSDADCGRLGLCRTGVCDCPSAFYGKHLTPKRFRVQFSDATSFSNIEEHIAKLIPTFVYLGSKAFFTFMWPSF